MEQQFIGSYKVLRKIGAGGMAKVYLAVHQNVPNLKVILKILDDPRLGDRFLQEADKLALLDGHPNICRIKHFFSHGEDTVIAMEYIDGHTLDERIKAEGKLRLEEAARIAMAVLDILGFAHSKDVFHRDIKPGNIMLDKAGTVKVIDFGIAKSKTDPNLTVAGTACGTPSYMAPEQFNPSEDTEYSLVDIYAVGTTLFVMLTGEAPFKGDNPFAIRDAKMFEDPPRVRSLNPDIPPEVDEIVARSIAREPTQRYQTAAEMAAALGPFAEGYTASPVDPSPPKDEITIDTPVPASRPATPPASTPATPRAGRSRKRLFIAMGVIIPAIIVAVAAWVFLSSQEGDETSTVPSVVKGYIDFTIDPSGDVYLDEMMVGEGTNKVFMEIDTGRHVVRVENDTMREKTLHDTILATDTADVLRTYRFTAPPPPPPTDHTETVATEDSEEDKVQPGEVAVGSIPAGADVFIDGELQSQPTIYTFPIQPGQHTIRVMLNGKSADTTFVVESGVTHKVKFYLNQ